MGTAATRTPGSRTRPLGPSQVDDLIDRWQQDGDRHAQAELSQQFLPLARRLAAKYRTPNEPLDDLIQVASVGLLGAINRFDPRRGVGFVAFAVPTILGELKRHYRNTGWAVHVPRGAQEMALRVDRTARQIATETGRSPTVQAIAESLDAEIEDVLIGIDAGAAHYSVALDAPASSGEGEERQPFGDTLGKPDDRFDLVDTRLSLRAGIARLPYNQRQVLGLRMHDDMRQADIARVMGCSQMHVSRLLRRATEHLRDESELGVGP